MKRKATSEKPRRGPRPKDGTIKQAVIEILAAEGKGLVALDLLNRLNDRNGSTLVRSSLSPQLSRLKQEGVLQLTGGFWHLPGQSPETGYAPGHNLFDELGPKGDDRVPEAQGVKAAPGGGG